MGEYFYQLNIPNLLYKRNPPYLNIIWESPRKRRDYCTVPGLDLLLSNLFAKRATFSDKYEKNTHSRLFLRDFPLSLLSRCIL